MGYRLLTDELWDFVQPLLPVVPPSPKGGRPRCSDRQVFEALLFILKTGIQWQELPTPAFGVSGSTCWRRACFWAEHEVWVTVHQYLLEHLNWWGDIDWDKALLDSASIPAKKGVKTQVKTLQTGVN